MDHLMLCVPVINLELVILGKQPQKRNSSWTQLLLANNFKKIENIVGYPTITGLVLSFTSLSKHTMNVNF